MIDGYAVAMAPLEDDGRTGDCIIDQEFDTAADAAQAIERVLVQARQGEAFDLTIQV